MPLDPGSELESLMNPPLNSGAQEILERHIWPLYVGVFRCVDTSPSESQPLPVGST
jgi:hypothetical protein